MIYITGDTHGEMVRFDSAQARRLKRDDTLIVCGDFGFIWEGGEKEQKALKKLGDKKYRILFVDGTHENFDLLAKYPVEEWNGGKVRHICGNLYYLMRGQVFTLENRKIFTMGGGESTEKQIRTEAGTWWECELPNIDEMKEAVRNLRAADMKIDYMITHEPPPRVLFHSGTAVENTNQLEAFFEQLVRQVRYEKWFFGSMHIDRKITAKNYAVFNDILPVEPPQKKRFRR
ncbi:MAG: hypothetical protein GX424_10870 [Clostridiales bacterium]|jgi:hypothetical protein|nr:hypothetical protein [Clostridiales bacterium]